MRYAGLVVMLAIIASATSGYSMIIESHDISIKRISEGFRVLEEMEVVKANETILLVWIQGEAEDVAIKVNGSEANFSRSGEVYGVELGNLTRAHVEIDYLLPKETQNFFKKILQPCKKIIIKLDGNRVYEGVNLSEGCSLSFSIKERVIERINYYMYTTLILILILIIILAYSARKRRTGKMVTEDPDVLKVKKDLLMNVLKEIEKRHRSKEMSDEVYNRLKEEFKRETVNIVRRLEEMEKS